MCASYVMRMCYLLIYSINNFIGQSFFLCESLFQTKNIFVCLGFTMRQKRIKKVSCIKEQLANSSMGLKKKFLQTKKSFVKKNPTWYPCVILRTRSSRKTHLVWLIIHALKFKGFIFQHWGVAKKVVSIEKQKKVGFFSQERWNNKISWSL